MQEKKILNKIPQTLNVKCQNIRNERRIPKSDNVFTNNNNTLHV